MPAELWSILVSPEKQAPPVAVGVGSGPNAKACTSAELADNTKMASGPYHHPLRRLMKGTAAPNIVFQDRRLKVYSAACANGELPAAFNTSCCFSICKKMASVVVPVAGFYTDWRPRATRRYQRSGSSKSLKLHQRIILGT